MLPRRPRYATDQQQAIVEQFQAPLNQQRDILMRDHLDQQQQQQLMQGIMNRSSHVQHGLQLRGAVFRGPDDGIAILAGLCD